LAKGDPPLVHVVKSQGSFFLFSVLSFLTPKDAVRLLTMLRRWEPPFVVPPPFWTAALRTALNRGIQLSPDVVPLHYGNLQKETTLTEIGALFRFVHSLPTELVMAKNKSRRQKRPKIVSGGGGATLVHVEMMPTQSVGVKKVRPCS
jgi:hypothetical protein